MRHSCGPRGDPLQATSRLASIRLSAPATREGDCAFLLTVMPRPHQVTGAIRECNHEVQILFVSSPGSEILISCAHRKLTPAAITLQFQGGVDSAVGAMRPVAFASA